jgi:hypothetical protein
MTSSRREAAHFISPLFLGLFCISAKLAQYPDPDMANDLVPFDGFRQDPQEKPPILVVTDDLLPFVPTARYVIQGIFIKDPFGSCHGLILKGNGISVKCTM